MTRMIWCGALVVIALAAAGCSEKKESANKKVDGGGGGTTGWNAAVGDNGTIVETFDDTNWQVRNVAQANLYAVTCVGNTNGWAVGANGFVAHTPDGGKTWTPQDAHTTSSLRTIHFAYEPDTESWQPPNKGSELVGVVAGDSGALAVSKNGGAYWKAVNMTSVALHSAASVLPAKLFVVVGDEGTLIRSSDLGDSWDKTTIPGAGDLTGVAASLDASLVLAVDSNGAVWASKDLAKTFSLETKIDARLNAVSLADDGSLGLAVGEKGSLLERDAAGNWQAQASGTVETLHAALVTHAGSRDYVSGANGTLIGSNGDGWSVVSIPTQVTLYGLENMDWN
jgi:photosystem II stability/assembly factor-like uncharacterized protein